eukprot:5369606-Prymnesium_polylepis.1
MLAYQLHAHCIELGRYCYIQLYDSELEHFFGYAHGGAAAAGSSTSWAPDEHELRRYPARTRRRFNYTFRETDFLRGTLLPTLASLGAHPLVEVDIHGPFLEASVPTLPRARISSLRHVQEPSAVPALPLDTCLCRFVTEPLEPTSSQQPPAPT